MRPAPDLSALPLGDLPGVLAEIAEIAGPLAALRIAEAKGGREVYIPRPSRLTDGHWLVATAGWDGARAVAERWGGEFLTPPLGPTGNRGRVWRAIREGLERGLSAPRIAALAGVHMRTVMRHRSGDTGQEPIRPDQHRLF